MVSSATLHERVGFGPPPDWIADREVDLTYNPPVETPVAMLLNDHQHHATRHEYYHRVVQRLESIAGVQRAAQWQCEFDPATQYVTIHSLSVRRGDRTSEHADPARLRILQREENLERYMLNGSASVIVLLEDVRVGDVVDTSFSIRTKARIFDDNFALLTAVPLDAYTRMFHLSVRFPNGHGMRWQTDSQKIVLNERAIAESETEWSWKVENFAPREPEPQMPTWHFHGRFIQVTDFPSWQKVTNGLAAAWEEKFDHPGLVQAANEIAAEPTAARRVERALRLVQDEIRYLSVNTELGGQVPTEPGVVLQRRFGDCKDKTFLLVHLLRRLGISARPVLVHSHFRHRVERFLPTPGAFNHAIVEYELEGERRWVDATVPLQGGGPLGRSVSAFGMGLPIALDTTELEPIAPASAADGSYEIVESFRLDSSASPLRLYATVAATGGYADRLRQQLVFDGGAATATAREQFYERIYAGVRRHADLEWRDDRERNELVLADAFVLPGAVVATAEPGVCGFSVCLHAIQASIGFQESDRRKHPLAVPFPCNVKHRLEFDFETLFRARNVRDKIGSDAFSFELDGTWSHARTIFEFFLQTHADHVLPEHFDFHRGKVRKAWAITQLLILIPAERQFSPGRISSGSLLPPMAKSVDGDELEREAAVAAPPEGIAPRLSSLPPAQRMQRIRETSPVSAPASPRSRRRRSGSRSVMGSDAISAESVRYLAIGAVAFFLLIRVILFMLLRPGR
jgi:Domain of Unknown Function with PDB structure (DUF3857)/Transglutaminase-like superfamily